MTTRIPIHVSNHIAFVWNVDHVATLRSEHRICGVLSGTLPHLSQQNVFLGLPLILMPEELVLLVEKQLATIVHDPAAHHTPTLAQLETWDVSRRQNISHQLGRRARRAGEDAAAAATVETATSAQDAVAAEIQQKRAEREARRRQLAAAAAAATTLGSGEQDAPAANAVYTVSVPTTSDAFPWYEHEHEADGDGDSGAPRRHTYDTLDAARDAGVWSHPANAEERARCEVFRDLWEKGYYMGGGSKFGGDWLVYPGDPLRYHSHFVATVQTTPSAPLRPMEVVAHGRLGTATKKAHLLCGWDPVSRDWAGFG
ncbi:tRNA-intron endonuclease catalytic domain-like protein [Russula earlei]|uniref:tRNA-intron endonuclease catalytic domain-like protein n=1 Tax=Russula earlei TaxID=71964 RepID=A0ACC0UHV3_9AGAM|nr:tRNA-intron endonuclease catalytic domain-like protein [Russula earlei]